MTKELDRKDLKIRALQQRMSQMVSQYEDQLSNLRVDYTILEQSKEQEIEDLGQQLAQALDKITDLTNRMSASEREEADLSTVIGEVLEDVSEEAEPVNH